MALRGLGRLHTVDRVTRLRAEMLLGHSVDAAVSPAVLGPRPRRRLHLRAQLEPHEVLDVVEDPLALLHCAPARDSDTDGLEYRAQHPDCLVLGYQFQTQQNQRSPSVRSKGH